MWWIWFYAVEVHVGMCSLHLLESGCGLLNSATGNVMVFFYCDTDSLSVCGDCCWCYHVLESDSRWYHDKKIAAKKKNISMQLQEKTFCAGHTGIEVFWASSWSKYSYGVTIYLKWYFWSVESFQAFGMAFRHSTAIPVVFWENVKLFLFQRKPIPKGSIKLCSIKCVETVFTSLPIPCDYKYPFQVMFTFVKSSLKQQNSWKTNPILKRQHLQVFHGNHFLYIFAPDNDCRLRWVQALKEGEQLSNRIFRLLGNANRIDLIPCLLFVTCIETRNNNLVEKYHPQFWMDGNWKCCQQSEKLAMGCHVYDPMGYG